MLSEGENRIIDENYSDILIEYSGDYSVFERFPNATYNIISYQYAVVHIPNDMFTFEFIARWGFFIVPKCYGLLSEASIEASGILRLRSIPNFNLRGQGVLIGFIDTGIDYTNPIFQYADKTTRIVSIWDQTLTSGNPPENFSYGVEYTREEINLALTTPNPLEVVPTTDTIGHGSIIAGIAAGNEVPESNFFGVAPGTELVVVKLKQAKKYLRDFNLIPEGVLAYSEVDILFGVFYLLQIANMLQRPLVICLAIGSSQGGHDGRGTLSNTLSLIATRPGIGIVVAAGNEGNGRRHYFGKVNNVTGKDLVELTVGEGENGFVLELWGESPSIYSIDITSPSGEYVPHIAAALNISTDISFIFEQTTIHLLYEMVETQTGDQLIVLRFNKPAPGIWRINVYERGDLNLGFHIWLPMEQFISQNTFFIRPNNYTTIQDIGNAIVPITVTAYNDMDGSLYMNASLGYTRTEIIKPEIAAPGVNIIGPTPEQGFSQYTGTSVAAAHCAGIVALVLEWGVVRKIIPNMSTIEVKKLLLRGAKRNPDLVYPNREWGYGIIDIYNVFDTLRTGITQ